MFIKKLHKCKYKAISKLTPLRQKFRRLKVAVANDSVSKTNNNHMFLPKTNSARDVN